MNNILGVMNSINTNELDSFFNNTDASFISTSDIKETKIDYSWLDILEDTLSNVDKIVRNPRRFIVQEEDVVIVEKIKKISQETIKHLSQHSENIIDLDKNGDVIPKKLLNVSKEDTTDLYENRFIYTLVKRLEDFMARQLETVDIISQREINTKVNYSADTVIDNRNIHIELKLEDKNNINLDENLEDIKNRILACFEIIESFKSTPMIKELVGCSLVQNPIRKTNLILRQPDFQKAYILWQYLDNFEFKDPKVVNFEHVVDTSRETKDEFTLAYFVNCNAIDSNKDNLMQFKDINSKIINIVNEYIYDDNQDINLFTEKITEIYKQALLDKEKRITEITNIYNNFINSHKNKLNSLEEC